MERLLRVEEVSKNFAGIQAVSGLSVSLEKGRIAGLIGPNGAGKTTLFNLITGFHAVTSGRIFYREADITGLPPYRIAGRGIARSFQDLRLYTKMTVLENCLVAQPGQAGEKLRNVYFRPGWVRRRDRECHQRAMEHLAYVGLQEQADRRAEDLAYGEQKLLAIARLLATEADLLLLDEPTSGLDRGSLSDMIQMIKGLVGQGKTICVIEHNLDVVRAVSDWVVFMDQGKALASGEPEAVLADRSLAEIYFGA
ncbi:MAG: hypothetical protein A2X50_15865 [Candidatus Rokubacteria bacterium GWF2_70_14]|nr:MAG: hypothetical protein A2X53_08925 [Candidatus Rokubacteria bacterium GWA2_70_23]OGK89346.1 MAG: hypothetical protein A2X50_15865 [Candidatus Rokubacteria bacterium GWF2_70_14]